MLCWPAFARLGTPDSRAALLARREQILFFSANHLTPSSRWSSKDRVNRLLLSRFQQPRTRVFAGHGFIGWTRRCGGRSALGQVAGILRFGFKASPVPGHRLTLFHVPPAHFLDAVWALIEQGALVSPALLENETVPLIDHGDWRTCWPLTFCDPADIRRRRARLAGNQVRVPGTLAHAVRSLGDRAQAEGISARRTAIAAPSPPRKAPKVPRPKPALSSNPATMRSRERYRRKARQQREQAWLQARQELLEFKQRVRRGLAPAASPEQLQVLDQAVADLYAAIDRW